MTYRNPLIGTKLQDLIDREGDGYIISDRFFRLWIGWL